jgi:hypothetical protein
MGFLTAARCEYCRYWEPVANSESADLGRCIVEPPKCVLVPVKNALGQDNLTVISYRPESSKGDRCREWRPKSDASDF